MAFVVFGACGAADVRWVRPTKAKFTRKGAWGNYIFGAHYAVDILTRCTFVGGRMHMNQG